MRKSGRIRSKKMQKLEEARTEALKMKLSSSYLELVDILEMASGVEMIPAMVIRRFLMNMLYMGDRLYNKDIRDDITQFFWTMDKRIVRASNVRERRIIRDFIVNFMNSRYSYREKGSVHLEEVFHDIYQEKVRLLEPHD